MFLTKHMVLDFVTRAEAEPDPVTIEWINRRTPEKEIGFIVTGKVAEKKTSLSSRQKATPLEQFVDKVRTAVASRGRITKKELVNIIEENGGSERTADNFSKEYIADEGRIPEKAFLMSRREGKYTYISLS